MSPTASTEPEQRVTLEEIKHRAESVRSLAVTEARGVVDEAVGPENMRTLVMVAGLVVVAASLAFFLGSRSGRARVAEDLLGA